MLLISCLTSSLISLAGLPQPAVIGWYVVRPAPHLLLSVPTAEAAGRGSWDEEEQLRNRPSPCKPRPGQGLSRPLLPVAFL